MATGGVLVSEDYITCSICFEIFRDPHAFPCLHTFCKCCIEALNSVDGNVACPKCREVCSIESMRKNFRTQTLIDSHNAMKEQTEFMSKLKAPYIQAVELLKTTKGVLTKRSEEMLSAVTKIDNDQDEKIQQVDRHMDQIREKIHKQIKHATASDKDKVTTRQLINEKELSDIQTKIDLLTEISEKNDVFTLQEMKREVQGILYEVQQIYNKTQSFDIDGNSNFSNLCFTLKFKDVNPDSLVEFLFADVNEGPNYHRSMKSNGREKRYEKEEETPDFPLLESDMSPPVQYPGSVESTSTYLSKYKMSFLNFNLENKLGGNYKPEDEGLTPDFPSGTPNREAYQQASGTVDSSRSQQRTHLRNHSQDRFPRRDGRVYLPRNRLNRRERSPELPSQVLNTKRNIQRSNSADSLRQDIITEGHDDRERPSDFQKSDCECVQPVNCVSKYCRICLQSRMTPGPLQ